MKLTAYTYNRVWGAWGGVNAWVVSGPTLTLWRRVGGKTVNEVVALPREVVGLADDAPPRPQGAHWSERPPSHWSERQAAASAEPRPPRIPPRERPSARERRR